ncbi:MAG: hypothetical protein RL590_553, partial [Actinomycetota bacterium]
MGTPIPTDEGCSYSVCMRAVRYIAPMLLLLQLPIHQSTSEVWVNLIAFNCVAIASSVSILAAPRISNRWAQTLTASALGSWTLGSILATSVTNIDSASFASKLSDPLYLLFYPLALLGLHRLISTQQKLSILEFVDASIVGLGLSTLVTAFALHPVLPHFDGDF